MEQFNSGELNFIFEIIPHKYSIGLMIVGNLVWHQEEVQKGDISIALIIREESFTSVFFKGHSGHNLIDPTLQDNVLIQCGNIPSHLPHWMCVQSSLCYQQWIDTWRSRFKQETNSVLLAY